MNNFTTLRAPRNVLQIQQNTFSTEIKANIDVLIETNRN